MLKFIEFNGIKGYARVMYNDVKDADKYRIDVTYNGRDVKDLLEYLFKLEQQLEQKDNIINEVREYIRSQYNITDDDLYLALYSSDGTLDKLENILNKGDK